MRVYVAGPMSGRPRWNFDAFEAATLQLRAAGFEVVSPHEAILATGFDPKAPAGEFTAAHYRDALREDVALVFSVDAVALLPGWESSKGARVEAALAEALGLWRDSPEGLISALTV